MTWKYIRVKNLRHAPREEIDQNDPYNVRDISLTLMTELMILFFQGSARVEMIAVQPGEEVDLKMKDGDNIFGVDVQEEGIHASNPRAYIRAKSGTTNYMSSEGGNPKKIAKKQYLDDIDKVPLIRYKREGEKLFLLAMGIIYLDHSSNHTGLN